MRTTVVRKTASPKRQMARDTQAVIAAAREVRASLSSFIKIFGRTSHEVTTVGEDGSWNIAWVRSSPADRLDDFYKANVWLQQAENQLAQLRGYVARAIERAERSIG